MASVPARRPACGAPRPRAARPRTGSPGPDPAAVPAAAALPGAFISDLEVLLVRRQVLVARLERSAAAGGERPAAAADGLGRELEQLAAVQRMLLARLRALVPPARP